MMSDLWEEPLGPPNQRPQTRAEPLASRMRPRNLSEIFGQSHLLGEGKLLRRAIEADVFHALLFYGPSGSGKTTLAQVIAQETSARFETLSATSATSLAIREKVEHAQLWERTRGEKTILFIDEIHRLSTNQQDLLLPYLEDGTIRFIGATTQNPFYALNSALLSRAQAFALHQLSEDELQAILHHTRQDERAFPERRLILDDEAAQHFARHSEGDARKCLNAFELAVLSTPVNQEQFLHIDLRVAEDSIQQKALTYDQHGDQHYDTASAFIKSIRGSDPDAALYWLAKMLCAGEDPRFIARRLIISASEDIGLADSNALRVALSAQQAFEFLGMPEGRIPLAHATLYLATAPKSNSSYAGLARALKEVEEGVPLAVPVHLRTASQKQLARQAGIPKEELQYHYSHDYPENYIPQAYLPEGRQFYIPTQNGLEKRIVERLAHYQSLFQEKNGKDK